MTSVATGIATAVVADQIVKPIVKEAQGAVVDYVRDQGHAYVKNSVFSPEGEVASYLSHAVHPLTLKLGDHVYVWRWGYSYSHHGIVVREARRNHWTFEEVIKGWGAKGSKDAAVFARNNVGTKSGSSSSSSSTNGPAPANNTDMEIDIDAFTRSTEAAEAITRSVDVDDIPVKSGAKSPTSKQLGIVVPEKDRKGIQGVVDFARPVISKEFALSNEDILIAHFCGYLEPKRIVVSNLHGFMQDSASINLCRYGVNFLENVTKRAGTCTTAVSDPAYAVVIRALSLVDLPPYVEKKPKVEYKVLLRNCELFSSWCKLGAERCGCDFRMQDGFSAQSRPDRIAGTVVAVTVAAAGTAVAVGAAGSALGGAGTTAAIAGGAASSAVEGAAQGVAGAGIAAATGAAGGGGAAAGATGAAGGTAAGGIFSGIASTVGGAVSTAGTAIYGAGAYVASAAGPVLVAEGQVIKGMATKAVTSAGVTYAASGLKTIAGRIVGGGGGAEGEQQQQLEVQQTGVQTVQSGVEINADSIVPDGPTSSTSITGSVNSIRADEYADVLTNIDDVGFVKNADKSSTETENTQNNIVKALSSDTNSNPNNPQDADMLRESAKFDVFRSGISPPGSGVNSRKTSKRHTFLEDSIPEHNGYESADSGTLEQKTKKLKLDDVQRENLNRLGKKHDPGVDRNSMMGKHVNNIYINLGPAYENPPMVGDMSNQNNSTNVVEKVNSAKRSHPDNPVSDTAPTIAASSNSSGNISSSGNSTNADTTGKKWCW